MKQIDVTIRTAEYITYRVEVEDDFDLDSVSELDDIREYPIVDSKVIDWSINIPPGGTEQIRSW